MALFKSRQTAAKPQTKIRDVLNAGLVIHANATTTGLRIVTFNHTASYFHYSYGSDKKNTAKSASSPFVGKGSYVEQAFERALLAFGNGSNSNKSFAERSNRVRRPFHTSGNLDRWLVNHKGQIRAVLDDDGSILCTLEGYSEANNASSTWVNLVGTGITFTNALADAFKQLADFKQNSRHISVKS